eukprot:SM000001S04755  [mRNA]  locus=s1:2056785:2059406:+ [translate_table: standard]
MVPPASWSPQWRLLAASAALAALLPLMLALPAAVPDDGVVEEAERSGLYGSADCDALEEQHRAAEQRGANGALPAWALSGDGQGGPNPPWIRGGHLENLKLTHRAQADIWIHQHPANCSAPDVRFAVIEWRPVHGHGLGSQLHIVTGVLNEVLKSGRVAVFANQWQRALHRHCRGKVRGRLACYFWPETSEECTELALEWYELTAGEPKETRKSVLAAPDRFVYVPHQAFAGLYWRADYAYHWGRPWDGQEASLELLGQQFSQDDYYGATNWYRSQAVRYMLRWPSRAMCQITNKVRHDAYGAHVALEVVAAGAAQAALERRLPELAAKRAAVTTLGPGQDLGREEAQGLVGSLWRDEEPYIPRPAVSIHVRQGDKAIEMKLYGFPAFMWYAYRLRYHAPDARHVWLSTEMQAVVDQAPKYGRWSFFFTKMPRQGRGTTMERYEKGSGMETATGVAFAQLLIAAECDYFIGVLGSNWNRLINELRVTGGRLRAGYLGLNIGEDTHMVKPPTPPKAT